MFRHLLKGLSGRLPSQCAACHAWPSRPACNESVRCFGQPVPRCSTCALPVLAGQLKRGACIVEPPPMEQALAAVAYHVPWSGLMTQFKFQEHTGWAGSFAMLMRSAPWVESALENADWLLPMPLSRMRLQEHGFNQAMLLALEPDKVRADILLRVKETQPQSSLPRKDRLLAVQVA